MQKIKYKNAKLQIKIKKQETTNNTNYTNIFLTYDSRIGHNSNNLTITKDSGHYFSKTLQKGVDFLTELYIIRI